MTEFYNTQASEEKKTKLPASKEESTVIIKNNFKEHRSCLSSLMWKTGLDQKVCGGWGIQVYLCCCLNIASAEEETVPVNLMHKSQTLAN